MKEQQQRSLLSSNRSQRREEEEEEEEEEWIRKNDVFAKERERDVNASIALLHNDDVNYIKRERTKD